MDGNAKLAALVWARNAAMTIAGLAMAVTPLALWASPTLTVFYTVLITCGLACCAVVLLSQIGPDDPPSGARREDRVRLPDRFIALLQNRRELSREDLPELKDFVQSEVDDPDKKNDPGR